MTKLLFSVSTFFVTCQVCLLTSPHYLSRNHNLVSVPVNTCSFIVGYETLLCMHFMEETIFSSFQAHHLELSHKQLHKGNKSTIL